MRSAPPTMAPEFHPVRFGSGERALLRTGPVRKGKGDRSGNRSHARDGEDTKCSYRVSEAEDRERERAFRKQVEDAAEWDRHILKTYGAAQLAEWRRNAMASERSARTADRRRRPDDGVSGPPRQSSSITWMQAVEVGAQRLEGRDVTLSVDLASLKAALVEVEHLLADSPPRYLPVNARGFNSMLGFLCHKLGDVGAWEAVDCVSRVRRGLDLLS